MAKSNKPPSTHTEERRKFRSMFVLLLNGIMNGGHIYIKKIMKHCKMSFVGAGPENNTTSMVKIKCSKHGIIKIRADSLTEGRTCQECANENGGSAFQIMIKHFNELKSGESESQESESQESKPKEIAKPKKSDIVKPKTKWERKMSFKNIDKRRF